MTNVNLHIYPSPFKNESRMLRECNALLNFNLVDKIIVVAIRGKNQQKHEYLDQKLKVHRISLFTTKLPSFFLKDFVKYYEFMFRITLYYLFKKVSIINIHSLHVLPLALLFKIKKSFVIYDTHELETEVNGARGFKKTIAKIVESIFILFTDKIITVSQSIQTWYRKRYNFENVYLIRNIPQSNTNISEGNKLLRNRFNLKESDILFIYQGILAEWRGTKLLIDTFRNRNDNKHLIFMGMGPMELDCENAAKEFNNIHFLPAVPPDKIIEYTKDADIGLSIIMNTCLSYYYCLPNKIFEYLAAGLPVMVSNFPDLEDAIVTPKLGWSVSTNKEEVEELINKIDLNMVNEIKSSVSDNKGLYNWEKESNIYKSVYSI